MPKDKLAALSIALLVASVVLSALFKGVFVVLLIPAAVFAWASRRDRSG